MRESRCMVWSLRTFAVAAAVLIMQGVSPAWATVDLLDGDSAFRYFSPTNIFVGQSVIFQGRAKNQGPSASGMFYVGVYLSDNNIITTADTLVGYVAVNNLPGGVASNFSKTVTVDGGDAPPGVYYIGYVYDYAGGVVETNEDNNTARVLNRVLTVMNTPPSKPVCMAPSSGATGLSLTPTLTASDFTDVDYLGDRHTASRWVVDDNGDWSSPAHDTGETTLSRTSLMIPPGKLLANKKYYWTVVYKDQYGGWSAWANASTFTTGEGTVVYPAFDASQPIAGSAVNRWSYMTAWNLVTGSLNVSPSWQNGSYTWNHPAEGGEQWIARFAYDQVTGKTTSLAWYYRQAHIQ